ncbi:MAG: hypothetical protein J7641_19360 [Cyanobacteria bacterium SID2]|nr:hypothetical protein [Cyanobacteria bacterium SID2]MBP0004065.1 hypothetical protein [Cyanobacteria bacterium SBC]
MSKQSQEPANDLFVALSELAQQCVVMCEAMEEGKIIRAADFVSYFLLEGSARDCMKNYREEFMRLAVDRDREGVSSNG